MYGPGHPADDAADGDGDAVTSGVVGLWRPVGRTELDLVAASGWRALPRLAGGPTCSAYLDREPAVEIARERLVPVDRVGYVVGFDVRRELLDRYGPAGPDFPLDELNASIVGAITERADYRAAVADWEFARAADVLGRPLPEAWRAYLQRPSWFRRGWLPSGCYLRLCPPLETLELLEAWGPAVRAHPGVAIIGDDGSPERLVVDLRADRGPVLRADIASSGWGDALRQADDVAQLVDRVEAGTFEFR